jgi:four helix bundle protein
MDSIPKGNAHLIDQLKRASISIPLNLAEGSGKMTHKDKKRFYSIARGSAMECAAILDVIAVLNLGDSKKLKEAKEMLNHITAVLTKVCLG